MRLIHFLVMGAVTAASQTDRTSDAAPPEDAPEGAASPSPLPPPTSQPADEESADSDVPPAPPDWPYSYDGNDYDAAPEPPKPTDPPVPPSSPPRHAANTSSPHHHQQQSRDLGWSGPDAHGDYSRCCNLVRVTGFLGAEKDVRAARRFDSPRAFAALLRRVCKCMCWACSPAESRPSPPDPRPPPAQVPKAFGEYVRIRHPYPFPYPRGRALYVKRHQTEPRGGKRVHKRGPWMFYWSQFGCARARIIMSSFACEYITMHRYAQRRP